jgi:hypothetical protein
MYRHQVGSGVHFPCGPRQQSASRATCMQAALTQQQWPVPEIGKLGISPGGNDSERAIVELLCSDARTV